MFVKARRFFCPMKFTYNITFVTDSRQEQTVVDYLRQTAVPALFNDASPARNLELRKVVETGGEKPDPQQGSSIALAASFLTEAEAREWEQSFLAPALCDFQNNFQNKAFFFVTLLENLL